MEIRFISTLTPDDEEHYAPSILHAAAAILDRTGLAYTLRIETTSEKVYQHNHPPAGDASLKAAARMREESVPRRAVPAGS